MEKLFTAEQSELRQIVRRFCEEKFSEERVREVSGSAAGFDRDAWQQMAEQLGLQSLAIPEDYDGAGFTQVELAIVMEELGRVLAPTPFLATVVLSANLLLGLDDSETQRELLGGIAAGEVCAAVAYRDARDAAASESGGAWHLAGTWLNVVDAQVADTLLVVAQTAAGRAVFAVDAAADGVSVVGVETLDLTRRQAKVRLDGAAATLLGAGVVADDAVAHMLRMASVALAAENVGGALKLLEISADYARTRVQFGRTIGSYQAIKQKLASVLVEVELARAAAHAVARAAAQDSAQFAQEAAMAHALTADTYVTTAYEAIQVHGGIGFTWEHPAHLYFRRAKANELLFGTPDEHRERAASLLLGV